MFGYDEEYLSMFEHLVVIQLICFPYHLMSQIYHYGAIQKLGIYILKMIVGSGLRISWNISILTLYIFWNIFISSFVLKVLHKNYM